MLILAAVEHMLQPQPDRAPGLGVHGLQQQANCPRRGETPDPSRECTPQHLGSGLALVAHRVAQVSLTCLNFVEIQQHQHQAVGSPAVFSHRPADGLAEVGAIAKPFGQVVELHLLLADPAADGGRGRLKQLMILLKHRPGRRSGVLQLVAKLAEQLLVSSPQLEAIGMQGQPGWGGCEMRGGAGHSRTGASGSGQCLPPAPARLPAGRQDPVAPSNCSIC